ncbi:MAG: glycosyltransferase family 39 protein [Thermodesulfobacteriota bacterium]|nr:glycosyltransferase family 39 protein [Thermodesulfobacteriota bacterium]
MISAIATLLIFFSSLGYGRMLLPKQFRELTLFAIVPGIWIISHLVFLAGILGFLYPSVLALVLVPGLILLLIHYVSRQEKFHNTFMPDSIQERLIAAAIIMLLLPALNNALLPPTARDSLVYHLALPKLYLNNHAWLEFPQNVYGYFPGIIEALFTLVLGLGGEFPAMIHFGFGILTMLAVLELGELLGLEKKVRLLCCLALPSTPLFFQEMTWAYVDLANSFFWTMTVIAFVRWVHGKNSTFLILIGMAAGAALCCKYTSLILVFALVAGLLFELKRAGSPPIGKIFSVIFIPPVIAVLAVSPWWLRNIILTGNPLFPFFWDIFPSVSVGWDEKRSAMFDVLLHQYGGVSKSTMDYFIAPFKVFLMGKDNDPDLYDGKPGIYYLLVWPVFFFVRVCSKDILYLLGLVVICLVFWTLSSQQARFLLVILPVMSVLIGWMFQNILAWSGKSDVKFTSILKQAGRMLVIVTLLALLGMNMTTSLIGFTKGNFLFCGTSEKNRDNYLAARLDYYDLYRYINNNLPKSAKIFMVMTGNYGYYLNREYFSDAIFESHTFNRIFEESSANADLTRALRQNGWTHLLIRFDFFLKERDPILTPQARKRLEFFFNRQCRLLKVTGPFFLYEILPADIAQVRK